MYICRPTLNLLLHSFVLWVIQRALKHRASLQCQFLNLYGGTFRIMPRRDSERRATNERRAWETRETHFVWYMVKESTVGSSYYTHSAWATARFISRNSSRWSRWPGVGQEITVWPLGKDFDRREGRQRWRREVSLTVFIGGRWR